MGWQVCGAEDGVSGRPVGHCQQEREMHTQKEARKGHRFLHVCGALNPRKLSCLTPLSFNISSSANPLASPR